MKIQKNAVVAMHYAVTTDHGDAIDTSAGKEPLTYIQGNGMLIPGFLSLKTSSFWLLRWSVYFGSNPALNRRKLCHLVGSLKYIFVTLFF